VLSNYIRSYETRFFFLLIPTIIYSSFIAFQGDSGSDTFEYIRVYNSFVNYEDFAFFEPGLYIYFSLLKFFNFEYELVNYGHALVVAMSLYLISIKRSPLLAALYIAYIGLNVDFSTLRQSFGIHLFTIFYLMSSKIYLSAFVSMLFHASGIFALVSKILNIKFTFINLSVLFLISVLCYYLFLERYLLYGMGFLVREDFGFILQSIFLIFICYFMGYSRKILLMVALFSILPIGYRIVFFLLIIQDVKGPRIVFNKFILCGVLLLFISFKLNSFMVQSIKNDGERSIITHYEKVVF